MGNDQQPPLVGGPSREKGALTREEAQFPQELSGPGIRQHQLLGLVVSNDFDPSLNQDVEVHARLAGSIQDVASGDVTNLAEFGQLLEDVR